jgi:hypothetical protein
MLVSKKLDESLGFMVYRKPIHMDLCVDANLDHHPLQKYAILS